MPLNPSDGWKQLEDEVKPTQLTAVLTFDRISTARYFITGMYVSHPDQDYYHQYYVIANVLLQVIAECKITTNSVFNYLTVKICKNLCWSRDLFDYP